MSTSAIHSVCRLAFEGMYVTVDGDCYPCCYAPDSFPESYGSVLATPAVELWRGAFAALRDGAALGNPSAQCASCPFSELQQRPLPEWWRPQEQEEEEAEDVFASPIGHIRLRTDGPALRAFFAHQLAGAWPASQEREVLIDVRHGDPATVEGPTEPEACPRRVDIEDCKFLISRDAITGVLPRTTLIYGWVRHWLWYAAAFLCAPEGWEAVHAAAVVKDREATLIMGRPGAGKSTTALRLLREGYRFLSDDLVLLSRGRKVRGWGVSMNLCPDTAETLDQDTLCLDNLGKTQWRPPEMAEWGEYPVGRVIVCGEDPPTAHAGHGFDSTWRPQILFYDPEHAQSGQLVSYIQRQAQRSGGGFASLGESVQSSGGGNSRGNRYPLRGSGEHGAVLVEVGFMSNPDNLERMQTEQFRTEAAAQLHGAIRQFGVAAGLLAADAPSPSAGTPLTISRVGAGGSSRGRLPVRHVRPAPRPGGPPFPKPRIAPFAVSQPVTDRPPGGAGALGHPPGAGGRLPVRNVRRARRPGGPRPPERRVPPIFVPQPSTTRSRRRGR